MLKYTLLITLFTASHFLNGQRVIQTNYGQKAILYSDGRWDLITQEEETADTDSSVVSSISTTADVFEIPKEKDHKPTDVQLSDLQDIKNIALQNELESFVQLTIAQEKLSNNEGDEVDIKSLKSDIKLAKSKYKKSTKFLSKIDELIAQNPKHLDKKIIKLKAEIHEEYQITNPTPNTQVAAQKKVVPKEKMYPTSFSLERKKGPRDPYDCELAFDGKDPVTGKKKKEVASGDLFNYTQEKLKPYFKSDDFMKCRSFLTEVGNNYYLTLDIRIKSKDARKNYGHIATDEAVKIGFINGEQIIGKAIILVDGEIEPYSGHTLYSPTYILDKEDIKSLKKELVDNIGIMWSSGYEQYDVYNVDFLMHQAKCLTK